MAPSGILLAFLACIASGQGFFLQLPPPPQPLAIAQQVLNVAAQVTQINVCYEGLGCFSTLGNFFNPLTRPLQLLPQSPDRIRPTFALFTRQNINNAQNIAFGDFSSVSSSNFNAKLPTKIIIHGFLANGNEDWLVQMKRAFLQDGDYNVIQLDWSRGNGLPYTQATANTRVIGALIAQMIKWLETEFGANREDFHLLGHSLGAHVSGYAGERLREDARQLGRITGMDPAGPYFENTHPEVRLDPTDARFVDAIHTDGDSILSNLVLEGGFGMMQAVGHVDFYPNGGKKQPGCSPEPLVKVAGLIQGSFWFISCDHGRVLPMVTSTILHPSGNYKAFPCDSYASFKAGRCADCGAVGCAQMGIRANEWKPNGLQNVQMFLDTAGTDPYESTGRT